MSTTEQAVVEQNVSADAVPSPAADGSPHQVVVVFSPKGGVGTTFLATNLAVALADNNKRRVCLVDLDLEFGDVAIMTGVSPERGILDVADVAVLDEDVLDRLITPIAGGVDCLLAPVDPAATERITAPTVAQLLAVLRERYEYVVVDTPSQLSEIVLEVFDLADYQILVSTPDIPAVKNVRLLIDTLALIGGERARREVVLNRADGHAGLQPAEVAEAVRQPLAAVVPADARVPASIDAGKPLMTERVSDDVAAAIRRLTAAITGESTTAKRRGLRLGLKTRMRSR